MGIITNYLVSDGQGGTGTVDIGMNLVEKSYLIDRYPELNDTFKQAGLWLWGFNNGGQLGDSSVSNRSSPVQTVSAGANWRQVDARIDVTACIKTNGQLWLWGSGSYGRLGNNATTDRSSPVQTVSATTNWKQVACGDRQTAAIKTDGTLWMWGNGADGRLGTNDITSRSSPVQTVSAGTNWRQVSCGNAFTGAIKTDGTLWMWGFNNLGQLATNDRLVRSSPVQTVSAGTNWRQVSCASGSFASHCSAIKTDGTLWGWGPNGSGQLGSNDTSARSSPVQTIAGGTNWKQVACGDSHTGAIKTDGTLWLWGQNRYGTLGINNTIRVSSPVQTVSGGTNWTQVSCGNELTATIRDMSNDYN
jgi:alpha-tubulin suppressor-like RCC1 family protein